MKRRQYDPPLVLGRADIALRLALLRLALDRGAVGVAGSIVDRLVSEVCTVRECNALEKSRREQPLGVGRGPGDPLCRAQLSRLGKVRS
jgi:hypothetical protein